MSSKLHHLMVLLVIINIVMISLSSPFVLSRTPYVIPSVPGNVLYVEQPLVFYVNAPSWGFPFMRYYYQQDLDSSAWATITSFTPSRDEGEDYARAFAPAHKEALIAAYTNSFETGGITAPNRKVTLPGYPNILAVKIKIELDLVLSDPLPFIITATNDTSPVSPFFTMNTNEMSVFDTQSTQETIAFEYFLVSRCDYLNFLEPQPTRRVCPSTASCNPSTTSQEEDFGIDPVVAHCECNPTFSSSTGDVVATAKNLFGSNCNNDSFSLLKATSDSYQRLQDNDSGVATIALGQLIVFVDQSNNVATNPGEVVPSAFIARLVYSFHNGALSTPTSSISFTENSGTLSFMFPLNTLDGNPQWAGLNHISPVVVNAKIEFLTLSDNKASIISTTHLLPIQLTSIPVYNIITHPSFQSSPISNGFCQPDQVLGSTDPSGDCFHQYCPAWSLTVPTNPQFYSNKDTISVTLFRTNLGGTEPLYYFDSRPTLINYSVLISSPLYRYIIPLATATKSFPLSSDAWMTSSYIDNTSRTNSQDFIDFDIPLGSMRIPAGTWRITLIINPDTTTSRELHHCTFSDLFEVSSSTPSIPLTDVQLTNQATPRDSNQYEFRLKMPMISSLNPSETKMTDLPPATTITLLSSTVAEYVPLWEKEKSRSLNKNYFSMRYSSPYLLTPDSPAPISVFSLISESGAAKMGYIRHFSVPVDFLGSCDAFFLNPARTPSVTDPNTPQNPWHYTINNYGTNQIDRIWYSDMNNQATGTTAFPFSGDLEQFNILIDPMTFLNPPTTNGQFDFFVFISSRGRSCYRSVTINLEVFPCPGIGAQIMELTNTLLKVRVDHTNIALSNSGVTFTPSLTDSMNNPIPMTAGSYQIDDNLRYFVITYTFDQPVAPGTVLKFKLTSAIPNYDSCITTIGPTTLSYCFSNVSPLVTVPVSVGEYDLSSSLLEIVLNNHWSFATADFSSTNLSNIKLFKTSNTGDSVDIPPVNGIMSGANAKFYVPMPSSPFLPGIEYKLQYSLTISSSNAAATCSIHGFTYILPIPQEQCLFKGPATFEISNDKDRADIPLDIITETQYQDSCANLVFIPLGPLTIDSFQATLYGLGNGASKIEVKRSNGGSFSAYNGLLDLKLEYKTSCVTVIRLVFTSPASNRITPSIPDAIGMNRQVTISWTLPTQRQMLLTNTPSTVTNYYKFTIHPITLPYQTPSESTDFTLFHPTSQGLLRGTVAFNTGIFTGELLPMDPTIHNNGIKTISFPETAASITLDLPSFPTSAGNLFANGFFILMSPIGDAASISDLTSTAKHHAVWAYKSSSDILLLNQCNSNTQCASLDNHQCNPYTGQCESITAPPQPWVISPLIIGNSDQKCTLLTRCPLYFTPNPECTQCICTTEQCHLNTRSVQVKFNMDNVNLLIDGYQKEKKWLVIERYLRNQLQLSLGGLRTIPVSSTYVPTNAIIGTSPYPLTGVRDYNESAPVGYEGIYVNFMNPSITQGTSFDTLLITFTITPFSSTSFFTPAQRTNRFATLMLRLKSLIEGSIVPGTDMTWLSTTTHPYLPFPISFLPLTTSSSPINNNPFTPFNVYDRIVKLEQPPTTRCWYQSPTTTGSGNEIVYGTCPQPTSTLLSISPFWSRCPADTTTVTNQLIKSRCIDYNNNIITQQSQWCTQGWYNYPITSSVPCPIGTPKGAPTSIDWITSSFTTSSPAGSLTTLQWSWDTSLYSSTYTVDVLINKGTTNSYSTLLTTVLASLGHVSLTLPLWEEDITTSYITLRCTNNAKSTSSKLFIPITGVNPCQNVLCAPGSKCNVKTTQCECLSGHYSFTSSISQDGCRPMCYGKCSSEQYCTEAAPLTCDGHCSIDKQGALCDIDKECENTSGGLNLQYCSSHGFLTWPTTTTTTKTCLSGICQCQGDWDPSSKCDTCLLTDSTIPSQRCNVTNTHYNNTKSTLPDIGGNCEKCMCLPGFYGKKCELSSIRGIVQYEKKEIDVDSSDQSIFRITSSTPTTTSTTQPDINGMHFISEEGHEVLIRDMALSLGIDTQFVNITKITQTSNIDTTTPPSPPTTMIIAATTTTTTTTSITYTITPTTSINNGNGVGSLEDLTNLWNNMQNNYSTLPVGVTEASNEIGSPNNIGSAQKPEPAIVPPINECPEGEDCTNCSDEEKISNGGVCPPTTTKPITNGSNIGMIIGIIVGIVVVVALLFIMTVLLVKYAKKNQKWCFEPADKKNKNGKNSGKKSATDYDNSHLELGETTYDSTNTITASSKANSKTLGSGTVASKSAVDLIEIKDHGENLPDGWSKQKHNVTGDQFYVYIKDGEMKSQKNSPLGGGGDVEDNGW